MKNPHSDKIYKVEFIFLSLLFLPFFFIDYWKILYGLPLPDGDSLYFYPVYILWANSHELINPFMSPIQEGGGPLTWHGWLQPMLLGQISKLFGGEFLGARLSEALVKYIGLFFYYISCNSIFYKRKYILYFGGVITYVAFDSFQGRPELVAALIILIWLYFFISVKSRWVSVFLSGLTLGFIVVTQPTIAGLGLCMLFLWNLDSLGIKRQLFYEIVIISFIAVLLSVFMTIIFYPYHIYDLISGIALQGSLLNTRGDTGGFVFYWFLLPSRPMHGLIIVVTLLGFGVNSIRRNYNIFVLAAFISLIFFLWFFSIRIPATSYNVMVFVPIFTVIGVLYISKHGAFGVLAKIVGGGVFVSSFLSILIGCYALTNSYSLIDFRKQLNKYDFDKIEVPLSFLIGAVPFAEWKRFIILKDEGSCPSDFDTITIRQQANKSLGAPMIILNCNLLDNKFKAPVQFLGQRVLPLPKDYRNALYRRVD